MNILRHPLLLAILLLILGVACSSSAGGTQAPAASATPQEPTLAPPTAEPTATSTPTPTSTPDATATKAAAVTAEAGRLSSEIEEKLRSLALPTDNGRLAWHQSAPEFIDLRSYEEGALVPIAPDLQASDFIIGSRITWETNGWMTCGIRFRSSPAIDSGKQYEFNFLRLSGLPAWAIEFIKDGEFANTPTDVRFSDEIDPSSGAEHEIVLHVEGEMFVVFINGVRQGRFFDYSKQATEGYFGFTAWQNSGQSTCTFEDSWIWLLD